MDKSEFRAQIETLPPGMRFVVRHVLPLCMGVFVVFGALLVVVLAGHGKQRAVIAAFCVVAMFMALANLAVFGVARRRMMRQGPRQANGSQVEETGRSLRSAAG